MKYIVTITPDGVEQIFLFPSSIDHDAFAESVNRIRSSTKGNWVRVKRDVISAGIVTSELTCVGESITLGVSSRLKIDTALLRASF